ncbi:MAG TPA: LuxR C-terminal-related transcriptional regulator, partial [Gaiellaceae bacterium]|nr:LuxR C-terminal-related transcriptional regulator [Gaiellaceae bacterium]
HHEAGDTARARALLEADIAKTAPGPERARALVLLARVRSYDDDLRGASALFEQAAAEAEPGSIVKASAREGRSATLFRLRESLAEAIELSSLAAEAATVLDVPSLLGEALATKAVSEAALARPEAVETVKRALALQSACADRPILRQPRFAAAVVQFWHDDLEGASNAYREMAASATELGDESSMPYVRVMLAQIDCARSAFEAAVEQARAGISVAEQAGQQTLLAYVLAVRAVAEAHLGRSGEATDGGSRALELSSETGGVPPWIFASWALGHLALARGDADGALQSLEPVAVHHRREAIEEPGALPFLPDYIEALIESARTDDAESALERFQGAAETLGRPRAVAASHRCRGLLVATSEGVDAGLVELASAVELAAQGDMPFEHARALLGLGIAQRRAKQRSTARETLEEAAARFEELGAVLWAERARGELKRISGRAATPGALTPAEQRVAVLVAEGKTNKEVAAALFLSDRTVEGHLARIFGKLGIRHRTEVARALQTRGIASPNTGDTPVSAESSAS